MVTNLRNRGHYLGLLVLEIVCPMYDIQIYLNEVHISRFSRARCLNPQGIKEPDLRSIPIYAPEFVIFGIEYGPTFLL